MGWRLLDTRGVQYKAKKRRGGDGVDNRRLYEWRRLLDHKRITMLSFDVSISGSIFKTNQ